MKILAVDDDPIVLELLNDALTDWGYKVKSACDGVEALKYFEKKDAPLLAIIDWVMPKLNGIDLIKRIRNMKNIQQPFIIMLTGNASYEDVSKGIKAGVDDYAIKPFRPEELRVRIANGVHMVNLQSFLMNRNVQIDVLTQHIKLLQSLFPQCPYCEKFRDDDIYKLQLDEYMKKHSKAIKELVSCPDCKKERIQFLKSEEKENK